MTVIHDQYSLFVFIKIGALVSVWVVRYSTPPKVVSVLTLWHRTRSLLLSTHLKLTNSFDVKWTISISLETDKLIWHQMNHLHLSLYRSFRVHVPYRHFENSEFFSYLVKILNHRDTRKHLLFYPFHPSSVLYNLSQLIVRKQEDLKSLEFS